MNPVLPEQAQEALDAFGHTASWEQRARLLLQWGERLAPLAEHERQEEHRVHGSKAWSGCSASSATATGASVPTATRA